MDGEHQRWPALDRLAPENADTVESCRDAAARLLKESGNAGFAMRGMMMAIADHYAEYYKSAGRGFTTPERSRASCVAGVHNAFRDAGLTD